MVLFRLPGRNGVGQRTECCRTDAITATVRGRLGLPWRPLPLRRWLVPTLERFPRIQKFLLGDRIQGTAMDVLEQLIEATYTRQRERHLANANLGLEKLRFFFRLAHTNLNVTRRSGNGYRRRE